MSITIIELVSGIGIGGFLGSLALYLWFKKVALEDIMEPKIAPIKERIKKLEEHNNDIKERLDKIDNTLQENTKALVKLTAVFDIITSKLEVTLKK